MLVKISFTFLFLGTSLKNLQVLMYVFTQHLHYEQNVTQGEILSKVQLVSLQSFPFSWQVATAKLKSPVCSTFYSKLREE